MGTKQQKRTARKSSADMPAGSVLPVDRLAWRRQRFLEVQEYWQKKGQRRDV